MDNKYKSLSIILGILVVILLVSVAFLQGKKYGNDLSQKPTASNQSTNTVSEESSTPLAKTLEQANAELASDPVLKDAKLEAPEANPIKDNVVVTSDGKPTDTSAKPTDPEAPKPTPTIDKNQIADSAIKLSVSRSGFSPNQFTVKAGAPVTIAITATDQSVHLFQFNDTSLYAVRVLVAGGNTRAITFNAPTKPGEYAFHCGMPDHEKETGKIIVK